MNLRLLFSVFITLILLFSCTSNKGKDTTNEAQNQDVEDTTSLEAAVASDTTKKVHEVKEFKENLKKIEAKYGEQWGFCECVVANDSVNNAIIALTDFEGPQVERLMERLDYISDKCQAFLGMDGTKTPEERAIHEKKVKDCLKKAKKK